METDWSALLKAVWGSAILSRSPFNYPDVKSTSGSQDRHSADDCGYRINNASCRFNNSLESVDTAAGCTWDLFAVDWARPMTSYPVVESINHFRWQTEAPQRLSSDAELTTSWLNADQDACSEDAMFSESCLRGGSIQTCSLPFPQESDMVSRVSPAIDGFPVPVSTAESLPSVPELVAEAVAAASRRRRRFQGLATSSGGLEGLARCSGGLGVAETPVERRPKPGRRCSECGLQLSSGTSRRRHQLVHSGQRPWSCGYCGDQFSLKYNCSRHCRYKHPGQRPLVLPS